MWLATHLRGQAGVAPGAQVALKFDFEPTEGQADPAFLPSSPDGRVPLSSADLLCSSVLREAHAYCALLGGCGPAPPDAPLPSFAMPFITEVRIAHELADPLPGECTMAYEGRFVYALALPKLGRSLYQVGRYDSVKPTAAQAYKLGAKMLSAVQYVHERGLLHLDVKPVRTPSRPAASPKADAVCRRKTFVWPTTACRWTMPRCACVEYCTQLPASLILLVLAGGDH